MTGTHEIIARTICRFYGRNPDELEPGDLPRTDGICENGDPGHYAWRDYVDLSVLIINALDKRE